ncbi:hypothetical protein [Aquibaculum arenosum]|uniref:Sel1 repeat family protein n=1 Tax=Aquibaculum arenosum TaxID=3032591 RepID=A0ABT5YK40_9PROT|nr:hypothetical protein [Fodinicurvata sp. CAU 1616]MDF2095310.1 hypothetical protein [Fodinicurvata sp. CAU 1616]
MRRVYQLGLSALPLLLLAGGCVGAATEGANIAKDKAVLASNIDDARAGDAEAQYKVGDALCCSVNEGHGFYDTPESVGWLCKAAGQDYAPAAHMLGEIYAGDVVSGVRVLRRVAQRLAGSSTNLPVAYAWLRRAEAGGETEAGETADQLWTNLSRSQRYEAEAMAEGHQSLPCTWDEVIASG